MLNGGKWMRQRLIIFERVSSIKIWCQPRGQARGPWIKGVPLPLPVWAHYESPALTVPTVEQYEELAGSVELETQHLLREHRYDTIGNFLKFYKDYVASGESVLDRFYRKYQPLITQEHHTCVGLGFELLHRLRGLNERFPGIASGLYLVSCEETIGNIASYVGGPPAADSGEKEHVLVCLKIDINGRRGVMLLDPGYHVARVITVMEDKLYPHTGWFVQSDEQDCKKEYNYFLCANDLDYVEWHERKTQPNALERTQVALIYVARPYLTAIDVTERRNLVYNFRSLLARDTKGHVTAGIYFPVTLDMNNAQTFTIFYQTSNGKKRIKMAFSKFCSSPKIDPDAEEKEIIGECARQLSLPQETLEDQLSALAVVMSDSAFVAELLAINTRINTLAEDN
ncbi:PREDICTED: uncharacterized protein LOC107192527 [Dufourea novaeangliae]|uniref:uncharacterized protein LOC107192527 n=1 Tax=Dufourea novaeangliae TaxID=178035 RepID=UPI00076773F4|nr:PREDICTED: uncharacterized protein LOC107192527 [Dufourea novaeangliae]